MDLYQWIKFHLITFITFRVMLQTSLSLQKLGRKITLYLLVTELLFLHSAFPLMALYQYIMFHLIPFYTFRDMHWRSFLLPKLKREVSPKILVTWFLFLHSGPSCSKLTTPLVNVSLKFQTLISQICQYFLSKKCEKLLHCKSFSHFYNKKISVYLVTKL